MPVDRALVEELKRRAAAAPGGTFRACLHAAENDPVQEMVVASRPDATRPPHRHPGRSESHLVIEGEITLFLFGEDGRVTDRLDMGPPAAGGCFAARVGPGCWHMIVFRSTPAVYYESMKGPYERDATNVWAGWGPRPDDAAAVAAYVRALDRRAPPGR